MSFNLYDPCDDSTLQSGSFQTCYGTGANDWGNISAVAFISSSKSADPFLALGSPTTAEEYYALFQSKANWDTVMALTDENKIVVTPLSSNTTVTGGEAKEVTFEDDTVVPRGHNSQIFEFTYRTLSKDQEKQLASLHGRVLGFVLLTQDGKAIIKCVTDADVTGASTNPFFSTKGGFMVNGRQNATGDTPDFSTAKFAVSPNQTFGEYVEISLDFDLSELQ